MPWINLSICCSPVSPGVPPWDTGTVISSGSISRTVTGLPRALDLVFAGAVAAAVAVTGAAAPPEERAKVSGLIPRAVCSHWSFSESPDAESELVSGCPLDIGISSRERSSRIFFVAIVLQMNPQIDNREHVCRLPYTLRIERRQRQAPTSGVARSRKVW